MGTEFELAGISLRVSKSQDAPTPISPHRFSSSFSSAAFSLRPAVNTMSHLTPVTSNFTESEKDFKQDITHVEHAQLDPLAEEGDAELAQYTDSSIVRPCLLVA